MKKFNLEAALNGAPVITRSGYILPQVVRLNELGGEYKVISTIGGNLHRWNDEGIFISGVVDHPHDLFMKPVIVEKWVVRYSSGLISSWEYDSKELALAATKYDELCTIHKIEVEE